MKYILAVVWITMVTGTFLTGPAHLFAFDEPDISLMDPVSFQGLAIDISPPSFWNPHEGQNLKYVAYTGPGEGGVFPGMKLMSRQSDDDLISSKAALSASVRVSLMDRRMENIKLVDELSTTLAGRDVLEQLFTCTQGTREVTAIADHFISSGKQYTFLYYHSTAVFDKHLPLARAVFSSIFVHGEEESIESQILFYLLMIICISVGCYVLYTHLKAKAVHQAGVSRLEVIRREEEIENGPRGIDFDEWEDDGGDVHGGQFNIVEIDNDPL